MLEQIIRTVLVYFLVLVVVRFMGKREIGQLSPFDFVVAIIIAELAAVPMLADGGDPFEGVVPILVLAALEVALAYAALHLHWLRGLLDGRPQVVIKDGHILKAELRKARYNLDDLLAQLRERGHPDPWSVEIGILETSGRLSVFPTPEKRHLTPEDMGITSGGQCMPTVIVMDGVLIKEGLKEAGVDKEVLKSRLRAAGFDANNVFLATISPDGTLYVDNGIEKNVLL